jgi:hypothetical protein
MPRLVLALGVVLALAAGAAAEFVARVKDFRCLDEFSSVPGKSFRIYHRNPRKLARALRIASGELPRRKYPVGTIIQVFPFEAMVKRGGGFNRDFGGWEFFNLRVSSEGTRILGRTATERAGRPLRNFIGACQDPRCHGAAQVRRFDRVCEGNLPPLPLTEEEFAALRADPRCP